MVRFTTLLAVVALVGCSPSQQPTTDTGPGTDASMMTTHDVINIDAPATDTAPMEVPDIYVPEGAHHTLTASLGPVHLDIAEEKTMCVLVRLNNDTPQYLRSITTHLSSSSHHLIFYRSNATDEQTTPFVCRGFSGVMSIGSFDSPLIIAQQLDARVDMPAGVGMLLGVNQMVRIELHGINIGTAATDVRGDITMDTVDQTVQLIPADVLFWGNVNIDIGPGAPADVHFFHRPWPNVKIFGLTSHTHHLGTRATINIATNETGLSAQSTDIMELHRSLSWSEPPLTLFDPPLTLLPTQGLHLDCHYQNTTNNEVTFGESFNDEMCFMWAYYYPAPRGPQACAEGYNQSTNTICYPP